MKSRATLGSHCKLWDDRMAWLYQRRNSSYVNDLFSVPRRDAASWEASNVIRVRCWSITTDLNKYTKKYFVNNAIRWCYIRIMGIPPRTKTVHVLPPLLQLYFSHFMMPYTQICRKLAQIIATKITQHLNQPWIVITFSFVTHSP